jgi:hypothetical protein
VAARKAPLRTVKPGETAPVPPKKPKTLAEAVEGGVYLEILVAQRREIAADLPNEKGPAKAALHRQLSLLAKEIEQLEAKANEEAAEDADTDADEEWTDEAL